MDIYEALIMVFRDTMQWIAEHPTLRNLTEHAMAETKLYPEGEMPVLQKCAAYDTVIEVRAGKTFQTAMQLRKRYPEARIAVHNFASATRAGGGVTSGSMAQEESLCRSSTLYPCLNQDWLKRDFYLFHRARQNLCYTDACIYSPDVMIIKTDDDHLPERMPESAWCKVDVLTCAAPNLREHPYNRMNPGNVRTALQITDQALQKLHEQRARHILSVALANGVQVLVLGAFGCGAFRNNPYVVAQAYRTVLKEPAFRDAFQNVTFAIYYTQREKQNYLAFQECFAPDGMQTAFPERHA